MAGDEDVRGECCLHPVAGGETERERPYRSLQDRIVRASGIEKLIAIDDVRAVLKIDLDRYKNHQVHSTTGEVPSIRFEKARKRETACLDLLLYHKAIYFRQRCLLLN